MKRDNWEGGHRVPLIASWPGTIKAGSHCKQVVELADFFATVSEITSITHGPNAGEDSYCMLPLLLGNEAPNYRDFAVHHSSQGKWAIRTGAWKLLLHSGSGGNRVPCPEDNDPVQLYDLGVDPFETTNVYSLHPELVTKLKALCLKCIEEGRSTPGASQPNDDGGAWTQLKELVELEV